MRDEPIPGAALEASDTFQVLAAPLWPRLPFALGYTGGARWVALYVNDDQVRYYDGANSGTGDTGLFLAYLQHGKIAPSLAGAHLGSADEETRNWLVVDMRQHVMYLAKSGEARRFLAAQWPRSEEPFLEYPPTELARLLTNLEETASSPALSEQLAEVQRESRANYRLLQQWLEEQPRE